ncbi:hypothetical protein QRO11_01895 [Paracidovorax citrulli]|uniref:Uncharacterized protein n=1 Tax=Paracidovorax citrulli TaxID=80869 RepID=A0ABY9AQY3_PARCI|nr:hypothetical protein [Paracidovorax citrulli]WIY29787.1 hypothetical protein QRO09_22665 [Paracidovorax citrulli]WIY35113.1 hypothetical protein QRO11_01895 [Paracidovorax citrulli]WIY39007.1 hypothetical protein QRO10_22860 [Paracidovorax citrulli]WIY43765.1 hypothetical protein QRO12_22975 [Paracidovorax citrulli]WIY49345.1 hypothetical protein QRO08_01895 [Paracidovorax citrulli]
MMTTYPLSLVPHAAPPGAEPAGRGAFSLSFLSLTTATRRGRREG